MRKQFKPFEAPASYTFLDPDTGYRYSAPSLNQLYTDIINYRVQNRLGTLEFLPYVVEDYLCSLPENSWKCRTVELERSMMMYVKGGLRLLKNLLFQKFCSQEEAETRASQCEKCPFNVFPDKSSFIRWADNLAIQQVGEKKTSKHSKLGNCEVCTCSLRSKVFYNGTLDKFPEEQLVKLRSVKCWQLKLSNQE